MYEALDPNPIYDVLNPSPIYEDLNQIRAEIGDVSDLPNELGSAL